MNQNSKLVLGTPGLEYLNGEPYRTVVPLVNDEGACYPIYFDKEEISKGDVELYNMALDVVYQKNFPDRAEVEKFKEIDKRIEQIESEAIAGKRLGENKEAFLNQLVQTSQNVMTAQGTLRQVKKNANKFTDDQLFEIVNTLSVATFQAVDLLRNVIEVMK